LKKCAAVLLLLLLTGCSRPPEAMERGMELRSKLLQSSACSFAANITADYGNQLQQFSMECESDTKGDLKFTVTKPESIAGISGRLTGAGGTLTFDNTALAFDLIAEEQLSPVSAPWILIKTLRSGNLTSACEEDGSIRLSVDDSYEDDPLRLDIWLNPESYPDRADILYDGRRILSVALENFEIA